MNWKKVILPLLLSMSFSVLQAQEVTALDIIKKTDELVRGQSNYGEMEMKIVRPKYERSLKFKMWGKGTDYSIIYVTYPVKEKGQVFLKRKREMWNYLPSIEKMIKIPPSMMMQSWMGSDLTNDDLVNASSIVVDYEHKILREEEVEGYACWVIELIPKEDAPVVWGKIIVWVSKEGYMTLKNEYYDEDEYIVNREFLTEIKDVGDRTMPTKYEIIPEDDPGHKTIMEFKTIKFNVPIEESFFSIQNMRRVR